MQAFYAWVAVMWMLIPILSFICEEKYKNGAVVFFEAVFIFLLAFPFVWNVLK